MTDQDDVTPPWGLQKKMEVSTHPSDTKDVTLRILSPDSSFAIGLMTHNEITDIVYQSNGNFISYNLQNEFNGKVIFKYAYKLDRLSGALSEITHGRMSEKERCQKWLTCGEDQFAELNTTVYQCSRTTALF